MWGIARGLLCLLLSAALWQVACAEPWAMAEPADPPPTATFVPSVFTEVGADGYWAWGPVVQGTDPSAGDLIHFGADGQQQARAFDKVVINNRRQTCRQTWTPADKRGHPHFGQPLQSTSRRMLAITRARFRDVDAC